MGFNIKTKLLAQCRVWKQKYQTQKLKMRLAGVNFRNDWRDMEIDSSRFIQKIGSTMMLNGCILLLIGVHMPWFYFGKFSLSLYEAVSIFPFLFSTGAACFVLVIGFLFFLVIRSLILKKFQWFAALLFSSIFILFVIVNYFLLKSAIYEITKTILITGPGVRVSFFSALLMTLSALLIYLSRKKDNHIKNKGMYNREKRRRRKRRPGKR